MAYYIPSLASKELRKENTVVGGVGTDASYDSIAKQAAVFNHAGVPWLYWMIIPSKSVDQSCDGATVPACCHNELSTKVNEAFEVGVTSARADLRTLIGNANMVTGRQDWSGCVY